MCPCRVLIAIDDCLFLIHFARLSLSRDFLSGLLSLSSQSCKGWSGGAMVVGKLPVPGRPTMWLTVGQGPTALAEGAGGSCLEIFTHVCPFSSLSPSLWETVRYRLKYCLKGAVKPKQPTNQHIKAVSKCWSLINISRSYLLVTIPLFHLLCILHEIMKSTASAVKKMSRWIPDKLSVMSNAGTK